VSDGGAQARSELREQLALAGLCLLVVAIWTLQYPYLGVANNDSTLYSIAALARLHPDTLANDIFLRFGSQDHYTLFGPLFAFAIKLLDLEPAAALLTLLAQALLFTSAWFLARQMMSARYAVLALGLLVALPSSYCVNNLFSYIESFLTPRPFAEAAVLACLAAAVGGRYMAATVCLVAAMFVHPIMGMSGIAMLLCMYVGIPRPRISIMAAVVGGLALFTVIVIGPTGPWSRFDPKWFGIVSDFTPYLFVSKWDLQYWGRIVVPAAVLAVGLLTSTSPLIRRLCVAALLTAAGGLLMSWIYCDQLHSLLFTQVQSWRWIWLAEALSILLLPVIARDCWQAGPATRAALLVLASSWVLRDYPVVLLIAPAAVAIVFAADVMRRSGTDRFASIGAYGLLVVAAVMNVVPKLSDVQMNEISPDTAARAFTEWLRSWGHDGIIYAVVLCLAWLFIQRRGAWGGAIVSATAAAAILAFLAPVGWQSWTDFYYTPARQAAFAEWRATIPRTAEVIWPGSPMGAWYLLDRPSYYSIHQSAGDIFSRAKAIEIQRRAELIGAALNAAGADAPSQTGSAAHKLVRPANADKLNARGLALACNDPDLSYVVSWSPLGTPVSPTLTPNPLKPRNRLRLFDCVRVRTLSAPQSNTDAP
jgi:hypothetical protein